jgi:hypothetical protein
VDTFARFAEVLIGGLGGLSAIIMAILYWRKRPSEEKLNQANEDRATAEASKLITEACGNLRVQLTAQYEENNKMILRQQKEDREYVAILEDRLEQVERENTVLRRAYTRSLKRISILEAQVIELGGVPKPPENELIDFTTKKLADGVQETEG